MSDDPLDIFEDPEPLPWYWQPEPEASPDPHNELRRTRRSRVAQGLRVEVLWEGTRHETKYYICPRCGQRGFRKPIDAENCCAKS